MKRSAILGATAVVVAGGGGCIRCSAMRIPANPAVDHGAGAISVAVQLAPAARHQVLESFGAPLASRLDKVVGNSPPGIYDPISPTSGSISRGCASP